MKKIITWFLMGILAAGSALALDLDVWGEVKTGIYTEQRHLGDQTIKRNMIHNNDDAGAEGRVRFGLGLRQGDFGLRTLFYQDSFARKTSAYDPNVFRIKLDFLYAYGSVLDNQLKISAGLLGESPWGSGGPELNMEMERIGANGDPIMGIRTEWKPNFLPGLNLGFVLNREDDTVPADAEIKFGDILRESIIGLAYEHEYFAVRVAYRLDREVDSPAAVVNGDRLLYRVEEHILRKLLPGMSVWANGFSQGLTTGKDSGSGYGGRNYYIQNWLYIEYDPDNFTAGLHTGYKNHFVEETHQMEFRPYFYYKFFENFLNVGVMAGMEVGVNDKGKHFDDAVYNFWFVEPKITLNLTKSFYTAFVYRYTVGTYASTTVKDQETHWFNVRICYTF